MPAKRSAKKSNMARKRAYAPRKKAPMYKQPAVPKMVYSEPIKCSATFNIANMKNFPAGSRGNLTQDYVFPWQANNQRMDGFQVQPNLDFTIKSAFDITNNLTDIQTRFGRLYKAY